MILKQRIDNCGPISDLALDFENIFEQVFGEPSSSSANWTPRSNVSETETGYSIELELPGVDPSEVSVELQDGLLEVFGEKKVGSESEEIKLLKNERRGGSFKRTFKFSTLLNSDAISATFKHGVLTIELPKAEQVLPKKVEIQISE